MVAIASLRVFKDFLSLALALVFGSLLFFNDFGEILSVFQGRYYDLAALVAVVLVSSCIVHMTLYATKGDKTDGYPSLFISLILATNVAFVVYWQTGLFMRLEEMVLLVLCLFGLFQSSWIVLSRNWRKIPGMVHRVVIVGNGELADEMKGLALASNGRYQFRDFIECVPGQWSDPEAQVDNPTREILDRAKKAKATKVVISLTERRGAFPLQEILNCKLSGMEVLDAPEFYERVNGKLMLENITPSWFIFSKGFKIMGLRRFFKRIGDIVLSLIGIILVSPLLPLVALAIKLDSPGPVLFKQIRVGKADENFVIYKFRSMRQDAEKESGAVWAVQGDNRITKLGAFLRKSRIDELPQLFNVLIGDMSLVGPRPERPEFVKDLKKVIPYYSERHFVKPGITGWAQVRYPYGASVEDAIEKLRYDLYYIKNYSLFLDLRIMIDTISVMARKMGR
ncbi:UDP-N-acetylgalactosamine-undecaprenyl-phosphate N-acetylgalactosaminephosphotransferase [Pseudodesulfovibrio hydrargyri]|uniref:UDP-N-acetylgalactosamine-undecaprenyl-phosphate N-acetylgalactosaminephosphotransferase n=1 Tax=Pseudodesulfovibrio hydrargyri TaxID=2125990 RepID=A0A1J5MT26_9BACT|nr:TIGR03013 family XrtA/PEP-CTERM system glycosyltransferase [Pseudodesulfovibrio hydrargyri]OIQ49154.1 UDP-N-acetylgalactosamine-undecaprenyl-phosphate N-acetylgalactosaminephosphotransferase [Pseudodesulfovibrio hydrargyri]